MAKLVYCKICKATYPLNVVRSDGSRTGKTREACCPMGHVEIAERDTASEPRGKK